MTQTDLNKHLIRCLAENRAALLAAIARARKNARHYPAMRHEYANIAHELTCQLIIADCRLFLQPTVRKQVRELAAKSYRQDVARAALRAADRRAA